jgi:hypothetical protein
MKYFFLLLLLICVSCEEKKSSNQKNTVLLLNDTIPETRADVSKKAVARYSEKIDDPLNDWKFAVELYETPATFKFLMTIEYEAINETDTITIPNFGIRPKVDVKKGKDPLSCIVGFYDKKGEFMEYKQVSFKGNQLKISTLKQYARTRFRVK